MAGNSGTRHRLQRFEANQGQAGDVNPNPQDPTTHGRKNFLRKQVERINRSKQVERIRTKLKEAEIGKFQQKENIDIMGITNEVCQDKDTLHKAKVAQDVMQFLDRTNPQMFQSKDQKINDDAVAVLNQLINKSEDVRKQVGKTLASLLADRDGYQGTISLERETGYLLLDIKRRNRLCGVPEDWEEKITKRTFPWQSVDKAVNDIRPTLEYVLARKEVIEPLIRAHDYRSRVSKLEFLNTRAYKGSRAKSMFVKEYVQQNLKDYEKVHHGMPPEIKYTDFNISTERIPWKKEVWAKARQLGGLDPLPLLPEEQQPNQGSWSSRGKHIPPW